MKSDFTVVLIFEQHLDQFYLDQSITLLSLGGRSATYGHHECGGNNQD